MQWKYISRSGPGQTNRIQEIWVALAEDFWEKFKDLEDFWEKLTLREQMSREGPVGQAGHYTTATGLPKQPANNIN